MTAPAGRLDPFALPAATTGRFVLLVVTAVSGTGYAYFWLVDRLRLSGDPGLCVDRARADVGRLSEVAVTEAYRGCVVEQGLRAATIVTAGLAVLLAATVVLYLSMPVWLRRRGGLAPVTEFPEVAAEVTAVAGDVDVYVSIGSSVRAGRAFGRWPRYAVILHKGLTLERWRNVRNAVLAHELAHIRNRDVDLTGLAIAAWRVFGTAIALTIVVVAVVQPAVALDLGWRMAALIALLWLARIGVLRTRELYADAAAASDPQLAQQLSEALDEWPSGRWAWLHRIYHPPRHLRHRVIADPAALFRLSLLVCFVTGALIGLGATPVHHLATLVWPDRSNVRGWVVGLGFGLLVAAVAAGTVWRSTLATLAAPRSTLATLPAPRSTLATLTAPSPNAAPVEPAPPSSTAPVEPAPLPNAAPVRPAAGPRTGWAAVALCGGVLAGQVTTPSSVVAPSWGSLLGTDFLIAVLAGLMLLVGCYAYLRWTVLCARSWLAVAGSPRRAYRFGVVQSAVVAGVWLGYWFTVVKALGEDEATLGVLLLWLFAIAFDPILLLSLVWAFVIPLVVARRRDGRPTDRPPLGLAVAAAAVIPVAYALAVVPLYPQLQAALLRIMATATTNSVINSAPAFVDATVLLAGNAALIAAGTAFLIGLIGGGRARTGFAVTAAGLAVFLAMPAVVVLVYVHIIASVAGLRNTLTTMTSLSMPSATNLAVLTKLALCLLLLAALPAAVLGSAVRAIWRPPVPRRGRRPFAVVLLLLPVAAATGLFATLTVPSAVSGLDVAEFDQVEVLDAALAETPHLPLVRACEQILATYENIGVGDTVSASGPQRIARAAATALYSDDPVLATMGRATVDDLRSGVHQLRVARSITSMGHYCGLARSSLASAASVTVRVN